MNGRHFLSERGSSFVVAMCFLMLSVTGIALLSAHVRSSVKTIERLPVVYEGKNIFNTSTARAVSLLETKSDSVPASGDQCTISTAAPYAILQFTAAGPSKWQVLITTQTAWAGCRCAADFSTQLCR
ncbi:MAG: hypothetical protein GX410_11070 [Elusimicrobia bacterium]|nr:hypothetical protein [Elusimicrobiota bacterium]